MSRKATIEPARGRTHCCCSSCMRFSRNPPRSGSSSKPASSSSKSASGSSPDASLSLRAPERSRRVAAVRAELRLEVDASVLHTKPGRVSDSQQSCIVPRTKPDCSLSCCVSSSDARSGESSFFSARRVADFPLLSVHQMSTRSSGWTV